MSQMDKEQEAPDNHKKKVVDPTRAKSEHYRQVVEQIAKSGECPFCSEHFSEHIQEILQEDNGWVLTPNSWPYENTQHHFLLINTTHKEQFSELTAQDLQAVMHLVDWAVDEFDISGGALTLRFGSTEMTGATVCHLHFHLIVPQVDPATKRAKTVTFPVG